ncbi:hypothetical protein R1sor_000367 [Riccia sorocarpa]|uniref:Uncharacterized protein n=1 Tax=Riccia sorocarpa TaxID=122646 RepID=A0ABD3GW43_9MARC
MYTGGINPLRDTVAKWIQEQFVVKLKLKIKQLRVLDRSHYLLTLETEEERASILYAGPQYLNGRFAELIPWTADYDTTTLTRKRKPAWKETKAQGQNSPAKNTRDQNATPAIPVANPYDLLGTEDENEELVEDEDDEMTEEEPTIRIETQATPELDLNNATAEEVDPTTPQHPTNTSSLKARQEGNQRADDMDASIAQKRGTYGNVNQEVDNKRRISGSQSQEKKSRAVTEVDPSVNQTSPQNTLTETAAKDTQLGAIIGRHWNQIQSTSETPHCEDSQPSEAVGTLSGKRGKDYLNGTRASQNNGADHTSARKTREAARNKKGGKK